MKKIIVMFSFLLINTSMAKVIKSYDSNKECTLYSILAKVENDNGDIVYERELRSDESEHSQLYLRGFSLEDLKVDFKNDEVTASLRQHIVARFDKPLAQVKIKSSNKELNKLLYYHNRNIRLLSSVCIDSDKNLIYGVGR